MTTTTTQTYDAEAIARAVIHHLLDVADDQAAITDAADIYDLTVPDEDDDEAWDDHIIPAIDKLTKQVRQHIRPVQPEVPA